MALNKTLAFLLCFAFAFATLEENYSVTEVSDTEKELTFKTGTTAKTSPGCVAGDANSKVTKVKITGGRKDVSFDPSNLSICYPALTTLEMDDSATEKITNSFGSTLVSLTITKSNFTTIPLTSASKLEYLVIQKCTTTGPLTFASNSKRLKKVIVTDTSMTGGISEQFLPEPSDTLTKDTLLIAYNFFTGSPPFSTYWDTYPKFLDNHLASNCFIYPANKQDTLTASTCPCSSFSSSESVCTARKCYYYSKSCNLEAESGLSTTVLIIVIAVPVVVVVAAVVIIIFCVIKKKKSQDIRADSYKEDTKTKREDIKIDDFQSSQITAMSEF